MSDVEDNGTRPSDSGDPAEDLALRSLLRGALEQPAETPDLTQAVQRKIRQRSGGKFYADGWSTAKHPPVTTYLLTSLIMLFVLGMIYALLAPLSGVSERAKAVAPVQVVPSPRR
jgi:hypothetical protein